MGESANRAFEFMNQAAYTTTVVKTVNDCERFNRADYKEKVWLPFETY